MRIVKRPGRWATVALALLLSAPAAASGERYVFPVPEPFRIGDEVFSPSDLSVRLGNDFTPVSAVHWFRVGDRHLGMLMVQKTRGEAPVERTVAVFHRGLDGLLELIGYAMPGGRTGTSYRVALSAAAPPTSATPGTGTVFVAAR